MVRRITPSQFQSKMRQAQSKIRQAESKYKQAVNNLNQDIRTYNSKVRAHNARVRANRDRLQREIQKLERNSTKTQYTLLRTSVTTVQRSYVNLEYRAESNAYDERFDRFLDLSEREAANSAAVMNVLDGDPAEDQSTSPPLTSPIDEILQVISQDVHDRWQGALFALNPQNPDAARHFCTSARELLTEILERFARDDDVIAAIPDCDRTESKRPTRRAKIRFFFYRQGIVDEAATSFVEDDMENVVQLFRVFNDGTHGSSGKFTHVQLLAIRERVEDAVSFLWSIISGSAFAEA
jgi:Predicted pPIWI-associating nuclease